MKPSAILACGLLSVLLAPPARAQDNEGENLFRDMGKRILDATSIELSFDYQIENRAGERLEWKTKGTLLLTKDNKAHVKVSGYFADDRDASFQLVSDGKMLKTKG